MFRIDRVVESCTVRLLFVWGVFYLAILYGTMSFAQASLPADTVVLRVNGQPVYADELESGIDRFIPGVSYHGGVSPDTREKYREQALGFMIDRELLYQEGVRQKIDVEDVLDAEFKNMVAGYGSRAAFRKSLAASGLDEEKMKQRLRKDILAAAYAEKEIGGKVPYSEGELERYYENNRSRFKRPPSMHIWHIILKVPANASKTDREEKRELGEFVAGLAREGKDFEILAEKYSEDDYRVVGGKLGLVHKGQLTKEIEDVAFSLDEGKTAGPIETIYGFHIVKAGEKVDGEQVPFEQVRDRLKQELEQNRADELKNELIERLKQAATIEVIR